MHPVHIYSTHPTTTTRVCVCMVRAVFTCICNVHISALTSPPALNLVVLSLPHIVCTCLCIEYIQPPTTSPFTNLGIVLTTYLFRFLLPLSSSVVLVTHSHIRINLATTTSFCQCYSWFPCHRWSQVVFTKTCSVVDCIVFTTRSVTIN